MRAWRLKRAAQMLSRCARLARRPSPLSRRAVRNCYAVLSCAGYVRVELEIPSIVIGPNRYSKFGTNRNRHRAEVSRNRNQRPLPARGAQIGGRLGFRAKNSSTLSGDATQGFQPRNSRTCSGATNHNDGQLREREERKDEPKAAAIGLLRANSASRE